MKQGDRRSLANHFIRAVAEHLFRRRIEGQDSGIEIGGNDAHASVLNHGAAQGDFRGQLAPQLGLHTRRFAQLHQAHDLATESFERSSLRLAQTARLAINDAKRSDIVVVRGFQRHPGIKPEMQIAGHHGIVLEPIVRRGVRHLKKVVTQNGVCAQRDITRRLGNIKTDVAFEPLPVLVHQRDERDGRIADERCQQSDIVEFLLGRRVEKLELLQRTQPGDFIGRQ